MTDSQDQPRRGRGETNFPVAPANNSQLSSESTRSGDTSTSSPDGLEFEEWVERSKQIIGLRAEEAQLHLQTMSLWERGVKLLLIVLLTLTVIGLAIAMFVVSPWVISLGLPPTVIAAWKRFGKEDSTTPADDEGGP